MTTWENALHADSRPRQFKPQTCSVAALVCLGLLACDDEPRAPRSDLGAGDESTAPLDGGAAAPPVSDADSDPNVSSAHSATRTDGGTFASDAAGVPIIGVIDSDDVVVVEAEAAAPLTAVCRKDVPLDIAVASTLPVDAVPLSITPDGAVWAFAVAIGDALDGSAPLADAAMSEDGGTSSDAASSHASVSHDDASPTYAIHVASVDSDLVIALPVDQDPHRGATLDATGKQLVTTRSDAKGFVLWELDDTGNFRVAVEQPFVRLNALALQGGVRFDRPVFSSSGTRLYAHEIAEDTTITQLVIRDGQWETELRITDASLRTQAFLLSAVSVDDLTVFGLSVATEQPIAWWRSSPSAPFETSVALEHVPLSVRADCTRGWSFDAP